MVALGIEDRVTGAVEGRGHFVALAVLRVVEDHHTVLVGVVPGVGDPAAVGGPVGPEGLQAPLIQGEPLVHVLDLACLHVADVDAHGLIHEEHPLGIRGPGDVIPEAGAQMGHLALLAGPIRGPHMQLVLSGAVAEVGHLLAIGGQGREALRNPGAAGEVHDIALLRRHREDLAPGLEHGPLALRGEAGVLEELAGVLLPWLQGGPVGDDLDLHLLELLRGQLQAMQAAAGFEHDVGGADGGEVDVVFLEEGELLEGLGGGVVGPEVAPLHLVAVRQEVELAAMPHGQGVIGAAQAGQAAGGLLLQVVEPDLRGHAPAVALPGAEVRADGLVGQELAVRRHGAELGVGQGQGHGQPALLGDKEELVEAVLAGLHAGGEEQGLAVGVPAHESVGHGVVRDPGGHPAGHRQHVDIQVPVVVGGESQLPAIRGEAGEGLLALGGGQALGHTAGLGHQPDVVGVAEGNLGGGDRRIAHEPGIDLGGGADGRGHDQGRGEAGKQAHGNLRAQGWSRWLTQAGRARLSLRIRPVPGRPG